MIDTQFVTAEESDVPVSLDRIDDDQGTIITLYRDLDGEGPDDERFFISFSLENAAALAAALNQLISTTPTKGETA